MNLSKDPERWTDAAGDVPESLQRLLRSAREDVPGQRTLTALGVAVPAFIAKGTGAAAATANAATAAKAGTAAKAASVVKAGGVALSTKLATVVVLGAIVGGSYYFTRSNDPAPVPSAAEASPQPNTPVAETPREANPPPVNPTEQASLEEEATPLPPPAEHKAPSAAKATSDELPLLQRARSALKSDPNKALSLVRRHAQEFPKSQFTQEREVIRIEALRKLGRNDEADRAGEDFNRRFPGSAHESKLNRESQ